MQNGKSHTRRLVAMKDGEHGGKSVYRVSTDSDTYVYDRANRSLFAILQNGKEAFRSSPHDGTFSSPLWVGKKWITVFTFYDRTTGTSAGPMREPSQVQAYEEVTVPAGTFKALKIHATGSIDDQRMGSMSSRVVWYAPELMLVVKEGQAVNADHPLGAGTITTELLSMEGVLFRKRADEGDAEAQVEIGIRFAKGLGVEVDHAEALQWHRKAAEQGHEAGKKRLEALKAAP